MAAMRVVAPSGAALASHVMPSGGASCGSILAAAGCVDSLLKSCRSRLAAMAARGALAPAIGPRSVGTLEALGWHSGGTWMSFGRHSGGTQVTRGGEQWRVVASDGVAAPVQMVHCAQPCS